MKKIVMLIILVFTLMLIGCFTKFGIRSNSNPEDSAQYGEIPQNRDTVIIREKEICTWQKNFWDEWVLNCRPVTYNSYWDKWYYSPWWYEYNSYSYRNYPYGSRYRHNYYNSNYYYKPYNEYHPSNSESSSGSYSKANEPVPRRALRNLPQKINSEENNISNKIIITNSDAPAVNSSSYSLNNSVIPYEDSDSSSKNGESAGNNTDKQTETEKNQTTPRKNRSVRKW
ncbi:MAG: hypothetical protein ABIA63_02420 [bacterium]